MGVALIETDGLSRHYSVGFRPVEALSDLSVSIAAGDFVAITGPSGSGKSTCLHLLGCLQSPSAGRYWFEGRNVSALPPDELALVRNTGIGFVFQSSQLLPRATALANVELPLMYAGVGSRERRERAATALVQVGLGNRLEHRPGQLSGGEMQRVVIARAVVGRPRLLLADEPTGALDSRTGEEVMQFLVQLNEQGITVVVVTHDADIARHARREMTLLDGRLVADRVRQ